MNRSMVVTLSILVALPVVNGFAADARSIGRVGVFNGQLQSGGYQGNATPTKPPILAPTLVFYKCHAEWKQCECYNAVDCGRMGQAGVCETGTYQDKPGEQPGGFCNMKAS